MKRVVPFLILAASITGCSDSIEVPQVHETARNGQILYRVEDPSSTVVKTRIYDTTTHTSSPFVSGLVTSVSSGNVAFTAYDGAVRAVADCVCDYRSLHSHAVTPSLGQFDLLGPAALSPDGELVTYTVRDPAETGGKLVVANIDGSHARTIANDVLFPCLPSVSPTGGQVAYFSTGQKLVVVGIDGSGRTELTDINARPGPDAVIVWSARDVIAYLDYILMHLFDVGANQRIDLYYHGIPAWSPDGRTLAACDNNGVVTTRDNGHSYHQVLNTKDTAFYSDVRWSSNGLNLVATREAQSGTKSNYSVTVIDTALHKAVFAIPDASHGFLLY